MSEEQLLVVEENQPVYNIRHRAFYFSKNIIEFIKEIKFERLYFSIFDQLLRSATSIGANLVEGTAGVSTKDYLNYHGIALKSANETKYWLSLIKEVIPPAKDKINELIKEANEISRIIATIIINIKNK
ncbi:MAG: four helix bundle protein [Ginsengibacter sp.]